MGSENTISTVAVPVGFLLNLVVVLISAYMALLIKSIRRESRDAIGNLRDSGRQQCEACERRFGELKGQVSKLFERTDCIPGYEARLQAGNEKFAAFERRIERLEDHR